MIPSLCRYLRYQKPETTWGPLQSFSLMSEKKNRDTPLCMKLLDTRNFQKQQKGYCTNKFGILDIFIVRLPLGFTKFLLPTNRLCLPTLSCFQIDFLFEDKYEKLLQLSLHYPPFKFSPFLVKCLLAGLNSKPDFISTSTTRVVFRHFIVRNKIVNVKYSFM